MDHRTQRIRIGTVDEIKQQGAVVVSGRDRPLAVFYHQDQIYAVDNRCPHMGFPLHRGTTQDGILTCHWHHARFDLASGCTFDLWADDTVLPSVLVHLTAAERSEERNAWRHPADLVPLVRDAFTAMPDLLEQGQGKQWHDTDALVETLLSDCPQDIVTALCDSLRGGATALQLAQALVIAACRRVVHFHTRNEFSDWNAVHHTFTYSNALYQAMKRTASAEMLRGVFHGAMRVYLDRFLNVPPAPLPTLRTSSQPFANAEDFSQRFLTLLDTQQQVDAAGEMVYHYLTAGYPAHQLYRTLVTALVREDAGFHSFQMVEAAIQQHRELGDTPAGHWMFVAASRFLAAHAPTQRERLQTTTIAHRLHRGEMLYA